MFSDCSPVSFASDFAIAVALSDPNLFLLQRIGTETIRTGFSAKVKLVWKKDNVKHNPT